VTAPPRRLRNRIFIAMVAIATGVLVFTGITTLTLTYRTRVSDARTELTQRAPAVATALDNLRTRLIKQQERQRTAQGDRRVAREFALLLRATLNISDATLVSVAPDGAVESGVAGLTADAPIADRASALLDLPAGLSANDLDPDQLLAGTTQVGTDGDTVFVAVPLSSKGSGDTPVVVLTKPVDRGLAGRAGAFFLGTALLAAFAAAVVSYLLARRFTRPLAVMGATAGRIAAGDLTARVDLGHHPTDELGELAATLNRMAEQLDDARGQERAFLLSVSHDLRTPLTSIRGYAEAMTDGTAGDAETRRRAAAVIAAESRRLERLVADLLQLARLDAREFSLRRRSFDAVATIRDALDAFRPQAEELGISLHLDAPEVLTAHTDPERLGQIVANLVENALKYADDAIEIHLRGDDGFVLDVRDDGPGIAPDELDEVFERLYTARGTPGRTVGTGLGLAIVRELVATMGGNVRAASDPDGGATFTVRLPLQEPPVATN
jgi:two-component system sensor histidine kinase BaeS